MAVYLEEFVESLENLPSEIRHYLDEIRSRDESFQEIRKFIVHGQKEYLSKGRSVDAQLEIGEKYKTARSVIDEKLTLAQSASEILSQHMKRLDDQIRTATKDVDEQGNLVPLFEQGEDYMTDTSTSRKRTSGRTSRIPPHLVQSTNADDEEDEGGGETVYCFCQQVSYGEMIACDNAASCPYEWFHYGCVGLTEPPNGTWYCPDCAVKFKKHKRHHH